MAFDLHPILNAGQEPSPGLWYAVSPEDSAGGAPVARVGACANFEQLVGGAEKGRVLLSAGATPEGSYSDLHQLTISRGEQRLCLCMHIVVSLFTRKLYSTHHVHVWHLLAFAHTSSYLRTQTIL